MTLTLGYLEELAERRGESVRFDRKPGVATKVWLVSEE